MKKILILGGAYQHKKMVLAAQKMGIITYVTDYNPVDRSPAKQIADRALALDVMAVDEIVDFCRREGIQGVIGPYLDPIQKPYQRICEKLGLPCFGNRKQTEIYTDKALFKSTCQRLGLGTIPSYALSEEMTYPVLVKPRHSRGSRGQRICFTRAEVEASVKACGGEAQVLIERYLGKQGDKEISYIAIDGQPQFIRVEDRFLGSEANGLERLAVMQRFPSRDNPFLPEAIDRSIKDFMIGTGLVNAPVMLQAFVGDSSIYAYDPGLRMPGDEFDVALKAMTGIDLPMEFVHFAMTGQFSAGLAGALPKCRQRYEKAVLLIMPCLRPGTVGAVEGWESLQELPEVLSCNRFFGVGDTVAATGDVRQRFCEICLYGSDEALGRAVERIWETLHVFGNDGKEMLCERYGVDVKE